MIYPQIVQDYALSIIRQKPLHCSIHHIELSNMFPMFSCLSSLQKIILLMIFLDERYLLVDRL